mmetsp:Transcript_35321/g.40808  ORF Transcript_35321/g.40808 Transcript_35321/m.40808 type:complete len:120 (-) Transcript_35321:1-360(-)
MLKHYQVHNDEVDRVKELYSEFEKFQKPIEQKISKQESKIQKLEAELARKTFLEDKKEKHTQRIFKSNENIKESIKQFITQIKSKYENVMLDSEIGSIAGKLSKLISNIEGGAATAIED